MKYLYLLLSLILISPVWALQITNAKGISTDVPYDQFFKLKPGEFSTSREKDGVVKTSHWKGIRFDKWLHEQDFGDFAKIRFVSEDRYEVSFNRVQWDSLTCWLVYAESDKIFPKEQFRIIFPYLREMHWVRDVKKVYLEDHKNIPMPIRFIPMDTFFASEELITDPKPFINTKGYYFDSFLSTMSTNPIKDIVLYSRDGLTQNLEHPTHLAGAILEAGEKASYNLKSPQVPGGMWMKDIVYLQCDAHAIVETNAISSLLQVSKILQWKLTPEVKVRIVSELGTEELSLVDALSEPMIFSGCKYFEILP